MKAVILDIGNVLVHYDHQRTLTAVAEGAGCAIDDLRRVMAPLSASLSIGDSNVRHLYETIVEETGAPFDFDDFLTLFCAGITRDDEALAYAVALQNRPETTVVAISNTNDGHVRWLDEHLPELQDLDLVIMSNEVGMAKPDAAIYQLALELLDLTPSQAIFVDDLAANVQAAEKLGMAGIVHEQWAETRPAVEHWLAMP